MLKRVRSDLYFFNNKPMLLLVYKETYFNINDLDHVMPSVVVSL
jgi:hypothetical protein